MEEAGGMPIPLPWFVQLRVDNMMMRFLGAETKK
jgi:hypothetical protein